MRRSVIVLVILLLVVISAGASFAAVSYLGGSAPAEGVHALTPDQIATQNAAFDALSAGPLHATCAVDGDHATCSPLADADVEASVKAGNAVYERAVRGGLDQTAVDKRAPLFASDELTCAPLVKGSIECVAVTSAAPILAPGKHEVVTYSPMHVDYSGPTPLMRTERPTIPLASP